MRNDLWPYYQTKTKAFFKDGPRRFKVIRRSKYKFDIIGDITRKIFYWNLMEKLNQDKVILTYKSK